MRNISFEELAPYNKHFEIVERKGIGHPDTLCDAIAEEASRTYSQYCLEHFGRFAHHWFDKVMLLGGESSIDYAKGEIIVPYTVIFAGKAAIKVGPDTIPLEKICSDAAAKVLSTILYDFDPKAHLKVEVRIYDYRGPGQKSGRYRPSSSEDLVDLETNKRVSNDCNICVGFAPFSLLENIVLSLENHITGEEFKANNQDTGFDVKIVGIRKGRNITVQVNLPFIAKFIPNHETYLKRVEECRRYFEGYISDNFKTGVELVVNPEKYSGRPYLTVTGTVADTGDIGVVGRGNRINGLITPFRPMSIEASAGKNPLDHTGKLYNLLAMDISNDLHKRLGLNNTVTLATSKEKPVEDPDCISIEVEGWNNSTEKKEKIKKIVDQHLSNIPNLSKTMILQGRVQW